MNGNYRCPKCGNTAYDAKGVAMTGTRFSKIFDIQNNRFSAVSCQKCKYTEFYKVPTSGLSNVFDVIFG